MDKSKGVQIFGTVESTTTIASSTTATAGFTAITIPKNTLNDGAMIEVWYTGQASTTGTPTLDIALYNGTTSMLAFSQITCTNNTASAPFWGCFRGIVRTTSSTGTILWAGRQDAEDANLDVIANDTTADTVDQTADITLSVYFTWGTSSASNTLSVTEAAVIVYG